MSGYVTVELALGVPGYGRFANDVSARHSHRPVTLAEWERIERRVRNGRRLRRTIVGIRHAPRPVLADGRSVDDVLDARHRA